MNAPCGGDNCVLRLRALLVLAVIPMRCKRYTTATCYQLTTNGSVPHSFPCEDLITSINSGYHFDQFDYFGMLLAFSAACGVYHLRQEERFLATRDQIGAGQAASSTYNVVSCSIIRSWSRTALFSSF